MANLIEDWKCGVCKKKIHGKIHPGGVMIMQHKQQRVRITGNYVMMVTCALCGGETVYTHTESKIEDFIDGEK